MKSLSRFGVAALVSLLVSSLIALVGYSLRLWMGFPLLLYLSIPFAILLGGAAVVFPRREVNQNSSPIIAFPVGIGMGILYSYLATRFVLSLPGFVALTLSCWVPSGLSAMAAANSKRHWLTATGIGLVCLTTIILMEPAFNAAAHNQQVTVALITPSEVSASRLEAHPETLGFNGDEEIKTAKNEVLEYMRSHGYRETFNVMSITRRGKGKKSLAILLLKAPITKEAVLPVPDGTDVVYVQGPQNWERIPAQIPVLRRGITVLPPDHREGCFGFFQIPDARGIWLMGVIRRETLAQPQSNWTAPGSRSQLLISPTGHLCIGPYTLDQSVG